MKTILKFEDFTPIERIISIEESHHKVAVYTRGDKLYALKPAAQNEAAEEQIKYELLAEMKVAVPETHVVKDVSSQYFIASEIIPDAVELGCIVYKHTCATKSISLGSFAEVANSRLGKRGLPSTSIAVPETQRELNLPIVGLYENLAPFLFIGDTAPVGRTRPLGPTPRGLPPTPDWHFFSNMLVALRGDKILCYKIDPDGCFCSSMDAAGLQKKELGLVDRTQLISSTSKFLSDGDHLYGIFEETSPAEAQDGLQRVLALPSEAIRSMVSEDWECDRERISLLTPERKEVIIARLQETQIRFRSYYTQLTNPEDEAKTIAAKLQETQGRFPRFDYVATTKSDTASTTTAVRNLVASP